MIILVSSFVKHYAVYLYYNLQLYKYTVSIEVIHRQMRRLDFGEYHTRVTNCIQYHIN